MHPNGAFSWVFWCDGQERRRSPGELALRVETGCICSLFRTVLLPSQTRYRGRVDHAPQFRWKSSAWNLFHFNRAAITTKYAYLKNRTNLSIFPNYTKSVSAARTWLWIEWQSVGMPQVCQNYLHLYFH